MLGTNLTIHSAAAFALNNAATRRGVVTGTLAQGMIVTIPINVLCFFPIKILTSGVTRLGDDHAAAAAGQGRAGPAAAQQLLGTAAGVGVHHPFSAARHSWAIDLLDKG